MTKTLEELRESLDVGCLPNTDRPRWFAAIDAAIRERADLWSKWQAERCFRAKAEAELAALKARIAEAPIYEIPLTKPKSEDGWARVIESVKNERSVRGKRVRLVVEK